MLSTITGVTCLDKLGTGRSQQWLKVETTPETTPNLEISQPAEQRWLCNSHFSEGTYSWTTIQAGALRKAREQQTKKCLDARVLCFLLLCGDYTEAIRPDQISLPIWPPPLKNPQKPQCRWQMAPSPFQIFYCPWPCCWVIIYLTDGLLPW